MLLLRDLLDGASSMDGMGASNASFGAAPIHAGAGVFPGPPFLREEAIQRGFALTLRAENAFRFELEQIVGVLKRLYGSFYIFVQRFGPISSWSCSKILKYRILKRKFPASTGNRLPAAPRNSLA